MVTDFFGCVRMMQTGLCVKTLTSALLLSLRRISSTMPFQERAWVFSSVAIQTVIKSRKENTLESLILSSETRLLIFK